MLFFVMRNAIFVQANVGVNTILRSEVPFLLANFDVVKKFDFAIQNSGKCIIFIFKSIKYGMAGKFLPSSSTNINEKNF